MRVRLHRLGVVQGVPRRVQWSSIGKVAHLSMDRMQALRHSSEAQTDRTRSEPVEPMANQATELVNLARGRGDPSTWGSGPMVSGWLMQLPARFNGVPSGK